MTEDDDTDINDEDVPYLDYHHELKHLPESVELKDSFKDDKYYQYNVFSAPVRQANSFEDINVTRECATPNVFLEPPILHEHVAVTDSQQYNGASVNALCPPSHVLKARRISKPISNTSGELNSIVAERPRKASVVMDNYHKELSNNSAVSPRFMALRKLTEVAASPHPTCGIPPIPPIPAAYHSILLPPTPGTNSHKLSHDPSHDMNQIEEKIQNNLIAKIDDIIEAQLQFHLDQIFWRFSETNLDARRFWEEQKKEMIGFATSLIDRIESQVDSQKRMALSSIQLFENADISSATSSKYSSSGDERESKEMEKLKEELNQWKLKNSEADRQLKEMNIVRKKNLELEKKLENCTTTHDIALKEQWLEKEDTLKRLREADEKLVSLSKSEQEKICDLVARNRQLKSHIQHFIETNKQLHQQISDSQNSLNIQKEGLDKIKCKNNVTEKDVENRRKSLPVRIEAGDRETLDFAKDFGRKLPKKMSILWADIMDPEEVSKRTNDEWTKKYQDLKTKYEEVCYKLNSINKNISTNATGSEVDRAVQDLKNSLAEKDEEIRHLKQAESVNRIQLDFLQLELNKCQDKLKQGSKLNTRKFKHPTTIPEPKMIDRSDSNKQSQSKRTEHITDDGYLVITTEINGQLSKYSVKLPTNHQKTYTHTNDTGYHQQPKQPKSRAPIWSQTSV
ncbi:hypothetical protein BDB01DRAFT_31028 [Pilobolus umbonatus]|nr:hypothetical protein BDB01DRAFT_31028 [Pilobolus umbonatus]